MKTALITGITGQDGSYLAELLLSRGYTVYGLSRQKYPMQWYMPPILPKVEMFYGDLRDSNTLYGVIAKTLPDEIYNLGGQGFIPPTWTEAWECLDINAGGLARILAIVERCHRKTKVFQASSASMFGDYNGPANENTPMHPADPYAVAKLAAHQLCAVYRTKGLFVTTGILFNHESPRRSPEMVTQKICRHIARWAVRGYNNDPLQLGVNARRDWGYAYEYVRLMHTIMQADDPQDYVIGTGVSHEIRDVVILALKHAELDDSYLDNVVYNSRPRPHDINTAIADITKLRGAFGWQPGIGFDMLINHMMASAIQREREAAK